MAFTKINVAKAVFDSAGTDTAGVANTTIAAHGLKTFIPSGAIITRAYYRVNTRFTTAGADAGTIALKVEGANDLVAAIAVSAAGDIWDEGLHGCLPGAYAEAVVAGDTAILDAARQSASYVLTTAQRELTATIAGQVLTGGKLTLYVEYVLS